MELAVLALLALVPGLVVLAGALIPRTGVGFEDLLRRTDLDWPRGVQEEEPIPWHVDGLPRRSSSSRG